MKNNMVLCPLIEQNISIDECSENKEIKEEYIPKEYKQKEDWRDICKNCKYSNY